MDIVTSRTGFGCFLDIDSGTFNAYLIMVDSPF